MTLATVQIQTQGDRQVILLPKNCLLSDTKFYLKQIGNTLVLLPIQNPWQILFESLDQFSDDFMENRLQPPVEIRESF
jgi:antitoxin VapB